MIMNILAAALGAVIGWNLCRALTEEIFGDNEDHSDH